MTDKNVREMTERAARYLAQKGFAAIEEHQAIVDLARQMLATGEVPPPPGEEDPHRPVPYPWEVTEVQAGQRRSIWLASIEDYGTGEGLTAHFVVSFAHDEDEFRRRVSLELGRELAHLADVRKGISEHPLVAFFLSQRAQATLEAFDRGENPPGAMSFVVRYHVNYS